MRTNWFAGGIAIVLFVGLLSGCGEESEYPVIDYGVAAFPEITLIGAESISDTPYENSPQSKPSTPEYQTEPSELPSIFTISLKPTLSKIPEKIQSLHSAAVPPSGNASQKNFLFLLRKKWARTKSKNVEKIFLRGFRSEKVGRRDFACGSRAKSFPPPSTSFHFLPARRR